MCPLLFVVSSVGDAVFSVGIALTARVSWTEAGPTRLPLSLQSWSHYFLVARLSSGRTPQLAHSKRVGWGVRDESAPLLMASTPAWPKDDIHVARCSLCRADDSRKPERASVGIPKTIATTLLAQAYMTCQTPNGIFALEMQEEETCASSKELFFAEKQTQQARREVREERRLVSGGRHPCLHPSLVASYSGGVQKQRNPQDFSV